ncbi:MAG: hypothetical protein KGJ78_03480 [Alphaproteobacteria bacterium]|nr:hypothetical protein [Alphaproteobacteria bacterium]
MTSDVLDKMEESAAVLRHEIEKLDLLGLSFAASLVRIAHLDLQMRLHKVTGGEIDVLTLAANALEHERLTRQGRVFETPGQPAPVSSKGQ